MYDALLNHGLLETSLSTTSGHRHILAFWLYHWDLQWGHGSNRLLLAVDWLLNGSLIVLLCVSAWALPLSRLARTLLCGWISVMLCWLINIALLGWGFNGINNFMSLVPGLLAIACLWRATQQHALIMAGWAGLLGILASLSFANGVLVWPTAFICLYWWRAPRNLFLITLAATGIAVLLYISLPGATAAQAALKWPGSAFFTFPAQVMGGPLYHLLRSWHLMDEQQLAVFATRAGIVITVCAVWQFIQRLRQRQPLSLFASLCVALLCFGAGSCLMLSMSRLDEFLDFTVDRFQIFALLVWIGSVGLHICHAHPAVIRRWEIGFIVFPLLALPAQLDWGARLAEYRNRVDMALLAYQVYLPVQADAERALHWNWENKLPAFFNVLEYLRTTHSNVFYDGLAQHLTQTWTEASTLPTCSATVVRTQPILARELLTVTHWPTAHRYAIPDAGNDDRIAGQRWFFQYNNTDWDGGVLLDAQHTVRGLVLPIHHSRLPRTSGLWHDAFNAYGIHRQDNASESVRSLVLLRAHQPVCQQPLR